MRRLAVPMNDPGEVIDRCLEVVLDQELRATIRGEKAFIVQEINRYDQLAQLNELHTVAQSDDINGNVTGAEMVGLYKRLSRKGSRPREIYDELISAPKHGKCPYCDQRVVSTLDHFLIKTRFPAFTVSPTNLVPACKDCNHNKGQGVCLTPETQVLHPYFDHFEDAQWLFANVQRTAPATFVYFVQPPQGWGIEVAQRLTEHFTRFKLGELYSVHAAEEQENITARLRNLHASGGGDAVSDHLREEFLTRNHVNLNSWQTAFYQAVSKSQWYCDGGFDQ